ncbi:helix-turn-helix domain-containing protein [Klenkia sp. PcliD-1-E]|uniref:helix-turn-helix domain-containing protein n=1 Tax=Klenkia sp. PcliD-1-E TaxID=2954492 RepID=UPI002096A839|nr:helix-turn-helix domain containing protein [Klenkia sp. PcliD-1-E]MCO7219511.1 helix-turn-helix domain containing protein [Klenkia sp. PcliD-1-E]
MPYPPRPQLRPLPQFAGTARNGTKVSAELIAQLEDYVATSYMEGRSLREIAELVDRSPTAVRRMLDNRHVVRRPPGAAHLNT